PLDLSRTFYPFGETSARTTFYLACDAAFSKPGAEVDIAVDLDATRLARPSPIVLLAWEYWNGDLWRPLGYSLSPGVQFPLPPSSYGFEDETQAFAADGVISFDCPPNWVEGREDVETGFWLRAHIAAGGYGAAADYRPPVVQGLTLSYTWPVPRIDTIRTSVTITADDLVPDWAFGNQTPLDPSKDFLPFGDKPKVGDTLYLADEEAFSKPDANLTLTVELTQVLEDQDGESEQEVDEIQPKLIWEFWDKGRKRWEPFGESGSGVDPESELNQVYDFGDGTDAFRAEGAVVFTCPPIGPREVNGQLGRWIRVRLAAGNYGVEARYEPVLGEGGGPIIDPDTNLPVYQLVPATFQPPSIRSITIGYTYTAGPASLEYTLTENDFAIEDQSKAAEEEERPFNPYWPTDDTRPTFYLGFQRPGSDVGFANRSTSLYCSVAEIAYERSLAEGRAGGEPAAVVWQYWNGERWARLGTRDQTQSFTERGLVTFIGPPDFRRSSEFGAEAFWLRAGWERGAYPVPPQLRRVLTNTTWAAHTLTVQNEVLGSSNGEPGQVFRSTQAPLLPGQRIEVREPELPSTAGRATLEAEHGEGAITTVFDSGGRPEAIWVRWHQVPDFYASGPRSRHYTLDRLTGEVRFGDGQRGMVPPRGRANLRVAWYQTGGGLRGNRPVGAIAQLKSAVPYVDGAINWEPAAGGSAQETLEAVKDRGPKTLRHRERAVAIEDFEDLAHQASPAVARVKGIPARGGRDSGSVGLIVVPRSEKAQPVPSLELLGRVEDYIQARLAPTVYLWVAGPDWLRVTVSAEIVPVSLEAVSDVLTGVLARLASFLHPLTGGLDGQGWAFGRKPYR
ncbi:MAG: putative baseplate assembly protein, partial [Planctomycetota bacterium]